MHLIAPGKASSKNKEQRNFKHSETPIKFVEKRIPVSRKIEKKKQAYAQKSIA
jgi:hypothetical protein